ncbi:MAG: glycosyltransferase, partial [Candidatus Micrarchaeota archaeon]
NRMKKSLEQYAEIMGDDYIQGIYDIGSSCDGKTMAHVNSTYYGGGVAEMLNAYIPLLNEAGLQTEWRSFKGSREFFNVTKKIHNSLQGANIEITKEDMRQYENAIDENSEFTKLEWYDLVVIDDPQPCGLITRYLRKFPYLWKPMPLLLNMPEVQTKQPWVWRCHIDLSTPSKTTWDFLRRYIQHYDAIVVSSRSYQLPMKKPHHIITPAIDPLSDKNRELTDTEIERELKKYGIHDDMPLIAQVSRFDPWKDPLGVIEVHRRVQKQFKCRLVLIGSMASDDPEGEKVFNEVFRKVEKERDIVLITAQNDLLVNALQRRADVIIQKSLKEGFGLTVSEAMWKGTPVVASKVGGIPLQIDDRVNGYLINGVDECANRVLYLLKHQPVARKIGRNAIEKVRKNFLMPRLVRDEIKLFLNVTKPTISRAVQGSLTSVANHVEKLSPFQLLNPGLRKVFRVRKRKRAR